MRAQASLPLVAVLALAGATALQAQRAHAGGAPVAVAAPRVAARPATPNLGGRAYPFRSTVATPTGLIAPAASYTGITPGALRPSGGGNRNGNSNNGRYGGRGSYPVYGGLYGVPYLPFLGDDSYYGFPSYSEQAEGVTAQANFQVNAQMQDAMAQQMDQMNQEIRHLRDSQMQMGYQMQQGTPPPMLQPNPAPAIAVSDAQPPQVPITLVMQNGAKVSVNNYAIMNDVIWDFSKQPARRIPVATINVAASEKATQDSGGEFPQLSASR